MANNTNEHDGGSGEFCFMCGRSDKQAGKMVYLPGGLKICQDCMQKTVDMASSMDIQSLLNNPMFMQNNPFFGGTMPTKPAEEQKTEKNKDGKASDTRSAEPVSTDLVEAEEHDEPEVVDDPDEEESNGTQKGGGDGRRPSISFLNLGDIFGGGFGGQQPKVKKKKKTGPQTGVFH